MNKIKFDDNVKNNVISPGDIIQIDDEGYIATEDYRLLCLKTGVYYYDFSNAKNMNMFTKTYYFHTTDELKVDHTHWWNVNIIVTDIK